MNKEHFDHIFESVFPDAVKQSFSSIKLPSADTIRSSWAELHRKREGAQSPARSNGGIQDEQTVG